MRLTILRDFQPGFNVFGRTSKYEYACMPIHHPSWRTLNQIIIVHVCIIIWLSSQHSLERLRTRVFWAAVLKKAIMRVCIINIVNINSLKRVRTRLFRDVLLENVAWSIVVSFYELILIKTPYFYPILIFNPGWGGLESIVGSLILDSAQQLGHPV